MKRTTVNLLGRHHLLLAILGLTAVGCAADPGGGGAGGAGAGDAGPGGAGGAGGSGGSGPPPACENAEALLQSDGSPSGLERCADGRLLRVAAVRCVNPLPPFAACETPDGCPGGCTGAHSACVAGEGPGVDCYCATGCATDADCPEDAFCKCNGGGAGSECVRSGTLGEPGNCRTGADCPSGQCRLGSQSDGCSTEWYTGCDTAASECLTRAECATGGPCIPNADGWVCGEPGSVCGRPFLVSGEVRTAALVSGRPVTSRDCAGDGELERLADGPARAALRAHFEAMTRLEHASIASFAQFLLSLMRFGAPAALLDATARAMRDEIDHTRRSADVVRRLSGREVVPGALDTAGAGPAASLFDLMASTLAEACVGETLGAVEAQALAEQCTDAALRETLTVIAEDEWRHAVLGWETLRWGLSALPPAAAEDLRLAADRALAEQVGAARASGTPKGLEHLGLFAAEARADLFATTGSTLVRPTLEALLQDLESRALRAA